MSRPKRLKSVVGEQTYFITSGADDRERYFVHNKYAELFIDTLYGYRNEKRYWIHCFVVMPEHFHLLITPLEITIERAMGVLKGGYSFRVKRELNRNFEVWQPGFTDRRVRVGEYERFKTYIEQNPVKAGLAKRAEDYPYGSACGRFELDPPPGRLFASAAKV